MFVGDTVTIGDTLPPAMMEQLKNLQQDEDMDLSLPAISDRTDEPIQANKTEETPSKTLNLKSLQASVNSEIANLKSEIKTLLGGLAVATQEIATLKIQIAENEKKATPAHKLPPQVIPGLRVYGQKNCRFQDFRDKWITLNYVGQSPEETKAYNTMVRQGKTHEEALDMIYDEFKYPE